MAVYFERHTMQLTYAVPTLDQVFDNTLWVLDDNTCPPDWQDSVYNAYPAIDRTKSSSLPWAKRKKYLQAEFTKIYQSALPDFEQKADRLNALFQSHIVKLTTAFSQAFDVNATSILNDMKGYPNLNPIGPRWLEEHSFYLYYKWSDDYVFQSSLHEIIHFFWYFLPSRY